MKVKNFGVWLRYDSRSGTHNMYKEYRELSRVDAVHACYQDMAARHRARFGSIHVCFNFDLCISTCLMPDVISVDPSRCRDPKDRRC